MILILNVTYFAGQKSLRTYKDTYPIPNWYPDVLLLTLHYTLGYCATQADKQNSPHTGITGQPQFAVQLIMGNDK